MAYGIGGGGAHRRAARTGRRRLPLRPRGTRRLGAGRPPRPRRGARRPGAPLVRGERAADHRAARAPAARRQRRPDGPRAAPAGAPGPDPAAALPAGAPAPHRARHRSPAPARQPARLHSTGPETQGVGGRPDRAPAAGSRPRPIRRRPVVGGPPAHRDAAAGPRRPPLPGGAAAARGPVSRPLRPRGGSAGPGRARGVRALVLDRGCGSARTAGSTFCAAWFPPTGCPAPRPAGSATWTPSTAARRRARASYSRCCAAGSATSGRCPCRRGASCGPPSRGPRRPCCTPGGRWPSTTSPKRSSPPATPAPTNSSPSSPRTSRPRSAGPWTAGPTTSGPSGAPRPPPTGRASPPACAPTPTATCCATPPSPCSPAPGPAPCTAPRSPSCPRPAHPRAATSTGPSPRYAAGRPALPAAALAAALPTHPEPVLAAFRARLRRPAPVRPTSSPRSRRSTPRRWPAAPPPSSRTTSNATPARPPHAAAFVDRRLEYGPAARAVLFPMVTSLLRGAGPRPVRRALAPVLAAPGTTRLAPAARRAARRAPRRSSAANRATRPSSTRCWRPPRADRGSGPRRAPATSSTAPGSCSPVRPRARPAFDRRLVELCQQVPGFAAQVAGWLLRRRRSGPRVVGPGARRAVETLGTPMPMRSRARRAWQS